jgi:hypothetical protein
MKSKKEENYNKTFENHAPLAPLGLGTKHQRGFSALVT